MSCTILYGRGMLLKNHISGHVRNHYSKAAKRRCAFQSCLQRCYRFCCYSYVAAPSLSPPLLRKSSSRQQTTAKLAGRESGESRTAVDGAREEEEEERGRWTLSSGGCFLCTPSRREGTSVERSGYKVSEPRWEGLVLYTSG